MEKYSTSDMRRRERIPFWQDVVCRNYVPIDCDFRENEAFKASISVKKYGRTDVSQVVSGAAAYERTINHIKANDSGDYLVTLMMKGRTNVEQLDRSCQIGPGDLCLLDTARPYQFDYPLPYQAIHLKIPRAELTRRLPVAETLTALRVAADGRYTQLAAGMLQSTVDLLADEPAAPMQLEPALIDLIALAFDRSFSEPAKGDARYGQIVTKAQEMIADRLADPDFDVSSIPEAIGVSSRSLYRAFAEQGLTPSRFLATTRLEAARDMILSGHCRTVSDVAMHCGFNDFSHFSRTFKAHFDQTPRAMLLNAKGIGI